MDTRPWLKSYPAGMPADIELGEKDTLVTVFDDSVARFAERPAFACMGCTLTYGDLDRLSRDFAGYLQGDLGLEAGSRVAEHHSFRIISRDTFKKASHLLPFLFP